MVCVKGYKTRLNKICSIHCYFSLFLRWKPIAKIVKARSACVCLSKFISFWHRFLFSGHFFCNVVVCYCCYCSSFLHHFFVRLLYRRAITSMPTSNEIHSLFSTHSLCVLYVLYNVHVLFLYVYIETFK